MILNFVLILWYLVAGFNGAPKDYDIKCEPTAIWYLTSEGEWLGWFPQFEDPNYVAVPEAYNFMIDWMYADRGYWIACSN